MTIPNALGNYQALRRLLPHITKQEWAALTKQEKQELGDMARKHLTETVLAAN